MNNKVVIIGAGGHSKVIADIIKKSNDEIIGFLDDNKKLSEVIIENYKIIGKIENIIEVSHRDQNIQFVIAIGNNKIRKHISEKYRNLNYYTAIHPSVQIAIGVTIGKGTVVMANACINSDSTIGEHCIINTGAIIEHDNKIEDYVHISPNATLCGTVKVGELTHIGAGSVIRNNIKICKDCLIGAGAVVVKDIKEEGIYIGVPAKRIK